MVFKTFWFLALLLWFSYGSILHLFRYFQSDWHICQDQFFEPLSAQLFGFISAVQCGLFIFLDFFYNLDYCGWLVSLSQCGFHSHCKTWELLQMSKICASVTFNCLNEFTRFLFSTVNKLVLYENTQYHNGYHTVSLTIFWLVLTKMSICLAPVLTILLSMPLSKILSHLF